MSRSFDNLSLPNNDEERLVKTVFQHIYENGYFIFSIGRTFFNVGAGRANIPYFHQFHVEILGLLFRCYFWIGSGAAQTVEPYTAAGANAVNAKVIRQLKGTSPLARTSP